MIYPDETHQSAVNAFAVAEKLRKPLSADLGSPLPRVVYQYVGEDTDYGSPVEMPIELVYEIWKSGGTVL